MFEQDKNAILLRFSQDIVNWLNQQYPDVNWIATGGPVHMEVALSGGQSYVCQRFKMSDFKFPPEIFFVDHDDDCIWTEKLLRAFAEWVLKMDDIKGCDVYLHYLKGVLSLVEDESYVGEKLPSLRLAGATWEVSGTL